MPPRKKDTIDLQDHDSPSAQDHHRQNHSTAGAHQAETLREVAHESAEEQLRSPRLSWTSGVSENSNVGDDLAASVAIRMQQQQEGGFHRDAGEDPLAVAQNGGVSSSDEGDLDGDDLDDDMMDRISSSPSIEDGAYSPTLATAAGHTAHTPPPACDSPASAGSTSSYLDTPEHLPLSRRELANAYHHLLLSPRGEYGSDDVDEKRCNSREYGPTRHPEPRG